MSTNEGYRHMIVYLSSDFPMPNALNTLTQLFAKINTNSYDVHHYFWFLVLRGCCRPLNCDPSVF